jgi:hypothetical protein
MTFSGRPMSSFSDLERHGATTKILSGNAKKIYGL